MKPAKFRESNRELTRPDSMTDEECSSLFVWSDDKQCISLWRPTWKERLIFLFKGELWLFILSGNTQPPVSIQVQSPFTRRNYVET